MVAKDGSACWATLVEQWRDGMKHPSAVDGSRDPSRAGGSGGLLVTLLNVVTSRALGQDFLPWESSLIPAGFGVLCLAAASG